jgi:hypothetical protein
MSERITFTPTGAGAYFVFRGHARIGIVRKQRNGWWLARTSPAMGPDAVQVTAPTRAKAAAALAERMR